MLPTDDIFFNIDDRNLKEGADLRNPAHGHKVKSHSGKKKNSSIAPSLKHYNNRAIE